MGMGVGRMSVIWFVVERFRSHCSIVTAAPLLVCQEYRKQRGREMLCFDYETDRLHGNTVRETKNANRQTSSQASRLIDK